MKVFVVITERDGDTTKSPGRTATEIIRDERRFAAETISDVHNACRWAIEPSSTVVAIYEEHPQITILAEWGEK